MAKTKMRYSLGLASKSIARLKGKQWYHQRFDGSPYLLHYIAEAEILTDSDKKKGLDFTVHICSYENDRADWFILMDDIKKVSSTMLKLDQRLNGISRILMRKWASAERIFYKSCRMIGSIDLGKLTDDELISLHDSHLEKALKCFSSSSIIDGFALGTDALIAERIKKLLIKCGREREFPRLFSKLTAPVQQSFINEAEVALLRIASFIRSDKSLFKLVTAKKPREIVSRINNYPVLKRLLKGHVRNYFWSKNNYVEAKFLDELHFLSEIREILLKGFDIQSEIVKIASTPKRNLADKKTLYAELGISKDLMRLLKISEDFTYWQDNRKKATYFNAHYSGLILSEIAKRTGFSIHALLYMSPREVSLIFRIPVPKKNLKQREHFCTEYWSKYGHEIICEEKARALLDITSVKGKNSALSDLRGLCASGGKALGKVKVVKSSKEIGKVKQGDIIVAVMTRPDYVVGMKKAAAIITNEGGITSHAAIVSRELGIPCVIGTKIATDVLHDGDLVEINADHGWLKIIKKKEN